MWGNSPNCLRQKDFVCNLSSAFSRPHTPVSLLPLHFYHSCNILYSLLPLAPSPGKTKLVWLLHLIGKRTKINVAFSFFLFFCELEKWRTCKTQYVATPGVVEVGTQTLLFQKHQDQRIICFGLFFDEEGGTFSAAARGALLTAVSLPSFPREPSSPPCWCPETSQVGLLFALSLPLAEGGPDRVERE